MSGTEKSSVLKPQPRVSEIARPFWDAANEGKLLIQRCASPNCGRAVFYPRVCCPYCRGASLVWMDASGRGQIISHTTVRRTHHDGFNAEAPYVFAAVGLVEGPLMYGQMPDAPLEELLIGREVTVAFAEHGPSRRIPVFRLT